MAILSFSPSNDKNNNFALNSFRSSTAFRMSEGIDSIVVAMNGVPNGQFDTSEQVNEEGGDNGQQNYGDLDDPGVKKILKNI